MATISILEASSPQAARDAIRAGQWKGVTAELASGYAQVNLAILPTRYAADFREFCRVNPKPCPVLEELAPGSYTPELAPLADLRTDLPRYRIFRDGIFSEEVSEITSLWQADFCSFLIGCSFTFDWALVAAGLSVRHQQQNCNVSMYRTNRQTTAVGPFRGKLVVSMRPLAAEQVEKAVAISGRYPNMHGAPVHIGNPAELGITDINQPDYGDPVEIRPGEIPVFWACGVTPQAVALEARLPLMITHAPGHMFITDLRHEEALRRAEVK